MDSYEPRTCARALCRHLYLHSANAIGWPCAGCSEANKVTSMMSYYPPFHRQSIPGTFAWCMRCFRHGVPPRRMREAAQVPDYPRYQTPIAELREALRKLGDPHWREARLAAGTDTCPDAADATSSAEPGGPAAPTCADATSSAAAQGSGHAIFDPRVRLCSWFDPQKAKEPCYLDFADGSTWPDCPYTKSVYLMTGGYVVENKIMKPGWAIKHEDQDGCFWDACSMCPKAAGKKRPPYCLYNHVTSDTHLMRCSANLEQCGGPPPLPMHPI